MHLFDAYQYHLIKLFLNLFKKSVVVQEKYRGEKAICSHIYKVNFNAINSQKRWIVCISDET